MIKPKEKKERSLGERLHIKGERCNSPKCAAVRKPYRAGVHGPSGRRKSLSDFGRQLAEKQKFKVSYGLKERNLRHLFKIAKKATGSTATRLLALIEKRLDNTVFRFGFAPSRFAARQLIVQGHILVNRKRARSPGLQVKTGDLISFREESKKTKAFKDLSDSLKKFETPAWLSIDKEKIEGRVLSEPETNPPFEINLLVESFSK